MGGRRVRQLSGTSASAGVPGWVGLLSSQVVTLGRRSLESAHGVRRGERTMSPASRPEDDPADPHTSAADAVTAASTTAELAALAAASVESEAVNKAIEVATAAVTAREAIARQTFRNGGPGEALRASHGGRGHGCRRHRRPGQGHCRRRGPGRRRSDQGGRGGSGGRNAAAASVERPAARPPRAHRRPLATLRHGCDSVGSGRRGTPPSRRWKRTSPP